MNERKKHQAINEALLWNMMEESCMENLLIQPTITINIFTINGRATQKENTHLNLHKILSQYFQ